MEVIHEMLTPVSCNKWARDLKKTWQSSSIFTITVSFLISLCVELLKNKSLSIQMVMETGIMRKILFTSTFYSLSCFCSLLTALSLYVATSVYMLYLLQHFIHLLDLLVQINQAQALTGAELYQYLLPIPPLGQIFIRVCTKE